jgi:DNA ligase (NAD+)
MCENESCPAKFVKHIRRILEILEVKGIDEKTIEKMSDAGLLPNVWHILNLKYDELITAGFGKKQSENWIKSVSDVTTTPQCLLATMGILGWGRRMFEIMFKGVDAETWVEYIKNPINVSSVDYGKLHLIDGIGPERVQMLRQGIRDKWLIVNEIGQRVTVKYEEDAIMGDSLKGKSFCATGKLTRGRKEIYADIIANGGEIKSGVTSKLDYLITGDSSGSKLDKAKKVGVTVIDEVELTSMMR